MSLEGKNCFRAKWRQSPFYSGGNIALLKLELPDCETNVLVTACDNVVHLVDVANGSILCSYPSPIEDDVVLHLDAVCCRGSDASMAQTDAYVPRGSYVAFSTRSLQLYVLQVQRQDDNSLKFGLLRNWTATQQAVSLVQFSSNGLFLLSCSTDGNIKAWNVFHHYLTHNVKTTAGVVTSLTFDENMQHLVVGNVEGWVTVINFVKKQVMKAHRFHTSAVEGIRLQGGKLVTVGRDRRISFAGIEDISAVTANVVVKEFVSCAHFCNSLASQSLLLIGSTDGVVASYHVNASTGDVRLSARSPRPGGSKDDDIDEEFSVRSIAIAPKVAADSGLMWVEDSTQESDAELFVASAAFVIQNMHKSEKVLQEKYALVGFLDQVLDVKLLKATSDAPRAVATNAKEVRVFRGKGSLSTTALRGHSDIVMSLAVTLNGALIATGSKDKTIRLWQSETGRCLAIGAGGHEGDATSISFNSKPTDSFLILISVGADGMLRLWDLPPQIHLDQDTSAAPVDLSPRFSVNDAHGGAMHCVAFAPNDTLVATGGKDKCILIWNVQGKKLYKEASLRGHRRGLTAIAFSPADRVLASSSNDGSIRLWSLVSFSCVKTMQADKVGVLQLCFFNRGTQLVSSNAEGILRFWAISASEAVATLEVHEDRVWALTVSEGDNGELSVVTGGVDGTVCMVEDYTKEEAERLEEERHTSIYNEQQLNNALRKNEFGNAFVLALQLNHPRHLRQVLLRWIAVDEAECTSALEDSLLASLKKQDFERLLWFTREWITNARFATVASIIIQSILKAFYFEDILKKHSSLKQLLEAFLAYSARHSARMHSSLDRTYYLDFLLKTSSGTELSLTPSFLVDQISAKRQREEAV